MALTPNTIWDIRTTGSDTANGGAFDPSQTAGMFTDGAATVATGNSPVFTSTSYNFVAGDVGAWLYIASGTNWTPGWYQIASVASNAATLSAAIGAAIQSTVGTVNTRFPDHANTVAGCATTASPTGATWSIDYSQQTTAQVTYTDLASTGAGLTASSAAHPFGAQQVGNALQINGGTNFTSGIYVLASVAAGVGTFVGAANITTGVGASGTGGLGGCLKTPGRCGAFLVLGNLKFLISGVTHTISSSSINVANGVISNSFNGLWVGWATNRHMQNTDAAPTLQFTTSGCTMFIDRELHYNLIIDGNSQTTAAVSTTQSGFYDSCTFKNLTAAMSTGTCTRCAATGCSAAQFGTVAYYCEAYANTATPFLNCAVFDCLSYANTGASTDGFQIAGSGGTLCGGNTAYSNGRNGFAFQSNGRGQGLIRCHSEGNAAYGYEPNGSIVTMILCSDYSNTSGRIHNVAGQIDQQLSTITLIGSAFVNAAGNNLALNATAGAGAALRGIAGAFPRGTTTGYADVGAVQHQDSPVSSLLGKPRSSY